MRFRALLTEGDAKVLFHREGFGRLKDLVSTTAQVRPSLVLWHRFGETAVGAGKAPLPRDPYRTVSLLGHKIVSVVDGIQPPPRGDGHSARPIFPPVTDVVTGEVIVSTVHLSNPRSVQVHRDRQAVARVPYPVNASDVG